MTRVKKLSKKRRSVLQFLFDYKAKRGMDAGCYLPGLRTVNVEEYGLGMYDTASFTWAKKAGQITIDDTCIAAITEEGRAALELDKKNYPNIKETKPNGGGAKQMSVLNEEEVEKLRAWAKTLSAEAGKDVNNLIVTIDHLRVKVGELEGQAAVYKLKESGHFADCDKKNPCSCGIYTEHLTAEETNKTFVPTCGAVKEPEAVMEEDITKTKALGSDHLLICPSLIGGACNCGANQ